MWTKPWYTGGDLLYATLGVALAHPLVSSFTCPAFMYAVSTWSYYKFSHYWYIQSVLLFLILFFVALTVFMLDLSER